MTLTVPFALAAILVVAIDDPRSVPPQQAGTAQSADQLIAEFQQAQAKWYQGAAKGSPPDRETMPAIAFLPRFREIAEAHEGQAEAVPALVWILNNSKSVVGPSGEDAHGSWALEQLIVDHSDSLSQADLRKMQQLFYQVPMEDLSRLYESVIEDEDLSLTGAQARFNLAAGLSSPFVNLGKEVDPARVEADRARARTLLCEIRDMHPESDVWTRAAPMLFELEHLNVGDTAPDFVGEDPDGNEIRLSDLRGRVVVIDFWGFW